MKFCKNCLYPENHPLGIIFDDDGICSGCIVHQEKDILDWDTRFLKLKKIVKNYKSRQRTIHDCIVPVSGARDSYFVLYVVKELLGLNPLLVNYNSHYNTKVGIENLANLRSRLGADFLQMTINPNKVKKITMETLKLFGSMYWHVLAGQSVLPVQTAVNYKIPLIIWGAHQGVDQVGMFSHLDEVEMTRKYRKDHDLLGFEAEDLLKARKKLKEEDLYKYFYPNDAELSAVGVKGIYLNNYIRWDSRKQHELMIKKFKYVTSRNNRSFDFYNDVDSFHYLGIHDYIKLIKHGFSKVTDHASREIRLKSMTRSEGIDLVKHYTFQKTNDLNTFLEWLNITHIEFNNIIEKHRNKKLWKMSKNNKYILKYKLI